MNADFLQIARESSKEELNASLDLLDKVREAKNNGEALGAILVFRYNTRIDALVEASKLGNDLALVEEK